MFVTFEGIDGSGKTTQIQLMAEHLRAAGHKVTMTREPGGSIGAEEIRRLLLSGETDRWSAETEILLFTAARRDHLEKTVMPALAAGEIVLCDGFVDSTRAYQGMRGSNLREMVDDLHARMIPLDPDLTILLDFDPGEGLARSLQRLAGTASAEDRFEKAGVSFQEGLRAAYLRIAARFPERITILSASGTPAEVADRIGMVIDARLSARDNAPGFPV